MFTGVRPARTEDESQSGALARLYETVLEMISSQASLPEVLACLCRFMEQQFPGMLCSVLLVDSDGTTLRHGAAPSLPPQYCRQVDGLPIGAGAGSCGTAAYGGKPVVVTDIASDPLWKDCRQFALPHGLKACWSTPIFSRAPKVLGTFAVYYREVREPDPQHWQMVECATHLAGIAIERERSDAELRAAETRYRTLVERLPAITYIAEVGVLGPWHYVSPQIESILGITPAEWKENSANWINHVHPEDREHVLAFDSQFVANGGRMRTEYRMLSREGRVLWFRDEAVTLDDAARPAPVMQGVLYDITEHKHLEDQLRQSQKMEAIGKLAGGVAHDFNNLLMIIQSHNERLMRHLNPDDLLYADADGIKAAVNRAASLTNQLLSFSRKQVLQPNLLNMNAVAGEVGKMLEPLIGEKIELSLELAPDLWRVKVDERQLEQAILNLTLNARDAMPHGGKLTIATCNHEVTEIQNNEKQAAGSAPTRPGKYVVLMVSDSGVGMDAETQRHIFEPFFSTKELGKGTGLGLASVYGVVQQSGGWVSFRSQLGHGSSFSIYLPEAGDEPASSAVGTAPVAETKCTETILVVEDEDEIRDMVREYLERKGYNVVAANNGSEALQVAQRYKGSIHLLLSDVVMPQLGGRELAQQVKEMRPRIKILLTSGYPEHAGLTERAADPAAAILQKPYPLNTLASRIRQMLDSAEAKV
ncbi:MAG TPA: ATP-binding protein [Terriglobales bacterium]|jgi:PAS domain S-box-containing protein|nr:ATP-binding protein [Terriglobales bacterium]